jgi:glycolate oxidase
MADVVEIDPASMTATVQAGVVNAALSEDAAERGLWYPPDPASQEFCTIGGNVATNAGGLCCLKYGVTRDVLLGLEVVLADGSAVRVGRRTRKGVVGYDLTGLFCGSEGTLGIITEATVRLLPPPGPASTLAASFPDVGAACEAIGQIVRERQPSLLELMDSTTARAVEAFKPMELDRDSALVFARSDAAGGIADVEWMASCCERSGATLVASSDEEAEGRMLMAARRLAYPALERLGSTLLDDVCVPTGAIRGLVEGVELIAAEHAVTIATFGHAGEGNMHPTIVYDIREPDQVAAAKAAFADIVELALRLGGTATGEHGVGLLKAPFVRAELGADAHVLHRAVKDALDPEGLLNPGKGI